MAGEATRWQKGQSGNPSGRPKSAQLSKAYRHMLESPYPNDSEGRTYAEVIAAKLADQAATGDLAAARELADRAEGKAAQSMKLDVTQSSVQEQFNRMSTAELETYAATGALPPWWAAESDPKEGGTK